MESQHLAFVQLPVASAVLARTAVATNLHFLETAEHASKV